MSVILYNIYEFLLGETTSFLGTLVTFALIVMFLGIVSAKDKKAAFTQEWKRPVVYLLFYIMANRIDDLLVDNMFGWVGSTKLLTVLGIIVTDFKLALAHAKAWSNILAPGALLNRLEQMERGQLNPDYIDSRNLDQQIDNIKGNLEKLKELNRLKQEMNEVSKDPLPDSSGVSSSPTQPDQNGAGVLAVSQTHSSEPE